VRVESPTIAHHWNDEDLRVHSPQYAYHASAYYPPSNSRKPSPKSSAFRLANEEGKKFYDIVKRSKANELPDNEVRVVNRILEKARHIT
jgi:hypothetical protein